MNEGGQAALPQAFFLPAAKGQRFCLFHAPQGDAQKGLVLYLHPFAEEMNASRRVVAQQCRELATTGYAVLQIDLLGCGESSGDFADATWSDWIADALLGLDWLCQYNAKVPVWLWGLRSGTLLACATAGACLAKAGAPTPNLLLWQPLASGQQQLQQFLRLHSAAQWLGRGAAGEPPAQALAHGRHAHVAGYRMSPALATELSAARLDLPAAHGHVQIIDLLAPDPQTVSPWILRQQSQWQIDGWQVQVRAVPAPPFWQNVVDNSLSDGLAQATREALS